RACPEPLKDGRVTVCLAGWSNDYGFIRIYPTRTDTNCHTWDVIKLDVERNERDKRLESWKIVGSKGEWETLSDKIEVVGDIKSPDKRRNIIGNLTDSCVNVINDAHRSLGIIKPSEILKTYFQENDDYGQLMQLGLPGMTELDSVKVKRDFQYEPRITYRCPVCQTQGKQHDQQILEWGFYEWFRKEPDKKEQVWENARFYRDDTDIYLLVGNQAAHRTSFMVISVLRVPKGSINQPIFPLIKAPENINEDE
ncbi:MAG: hypothetical protein ABI835_03405, partial [Chloroflexota bacterium]